MIEFDFSWVEVQGRSVKGSTLTAHKVDRVVNAPKLEGENVNGSPEEENQSVKQDKIDRGKKKDFQPTPIKNSPTKVDQDSEEENRTKDQVTFDFEDN